MYKLLIVDDEPLVQVGISSMLNWSELNIELCGTAMNGQAALQIIEESSPDIVITDIKMPIMSGLELARICNERYGSHHPSFIILTSYEDFQMAKEALTYQVADYLVKLELTSDILRSSIEKVIHMQEKYTTATQKKVAPPDNTYLFYDKFFIRLLNNLFENKEQFLLQSKDLNLDFHYASYSCCYGEIVSSQTELSAANNQLSLFGSTMQMLKEIVVKYKSCYSLPLDLKHFALIFCFEDVPAATYGKELEEILTALTTTLHNYYNVNFRIGIGSLVEAPFSIDESFQYARQAYALTDGEHPTSFFEDCLKADSYHNSFNIGLFKDNLTRAFEEFDADILQETIHQITDLFLNNPSYYVQAMDAACNILFLSISLLNDGEKMLTTIFADYPDSYRSIYRQTSVEQIVSWLSFFTDHLSELFIERKKDFKNHIVANVKHYISDHVTDHLSLNEVAAVFGISPNYLSQLFKKYNDIGFNEYVTQTKIQQAKQLLLDNNYKVYEVAEMLGFESAFYFSKVFKKVEGVSPTEYLNSQFI